MPNTNDQDPAADAPLIVRARAILSPIDRNRQIIKLRSAGFSEPDIGAELGIIPAVVARVALRDTDILARTPRPLEMIARHVLGQITHDDLMNDLLARQYTTGYIPDDSYDGWVRGTWSDVEVANLTGLITKSDFCRILPLAPSP